MSLLPVPDSGCVAERQSRRIGRIAMTVTIIVSLVMVALLVRVVQLQIRPDQRITKRVSHRYSTSHTFARRGSLLDVRGRVLAVTRLGYRLFADPKMIKDHVYFAAHVANLIDDDPVRIDKLLDKPATCRYVVIRPLINDALAKRVRDNPVRGLFMEKTHVRQYPRGKLAGQLLGMVGAENNGQGGIEYALNDLLLGRPGVAPTMRDVKRRPLWIDRIGFKPPRDGHDVRLSIDSQVQSIAEQALSEACGKYKADRGELIVMEAQTGQVLAMANWPPFDPTDNSNKADISMRRNRCVTDPYEPGSIFKPFIHAAASVAGLAQQDRKVDCTTAGLWVTDYGRRLHDSHAHGTITWAKVLILSSNIGMGKVASQLGTRRMYEAVRTYGFGSRTGIGLPGESRGIVNPLRKWGRYSLTSIPMGQEVAVTPIQMVKAFSAFANHGRIVSPSVLADEATSPILSHAIDPVVADRTRILLRRVVTEGTGRRAKSKLYQIWGKTGTASVPDRVRGGYKPNVYTASFICGAPLADPRVIVLVAVHEPNKKIGYYGGVVAAPYAKQVVEQTLTYLGVRPDVEPIEQKRSGSSAMLTSY